MSRRIAELSLAALRMAASSSCADRAAVARWLYRFGTAPRTPAIDRDFGPEDDPMAVLGLTAGGSVRRRLEAGYEPTSLQGWYSFARTPVRAQVAAVCKLYVSPQPHALADAFPRIAASFARADVRSFKVGRGIEGLLRPDKIVAYFEDATHMGDVADTLRRALGGCPASGVPFTAQLGDDALLSSGRDPPGATSWRGWVTERLAGSLGAARSRKGMDRVTAALAEMRRAGVDPDRWCLAAPP